MNDSKKDSIERLWSWILHEDTLFANRINFFLVAESMFFAAFAALSISSTNNVKILLVVGIGGILLSLIWIYLSYYQIYTTMRPIKRELAENLSEYLHVVEKRSNLIGANHLLGFIVPSIFIIMWLILFFL